MGTAGIGQRAVGAAGAVGQWGQQDSRGIKYNGDSGGSGRQGPGQGRGRACV